MNGSKEVEIFHVVKNNSEASCILNEFTTTFNVPCCLWLTEYNVRFEHFVQKIPSCIILLN
jgi:hypothetical protein